MFPNSHLILQVILFAIVASISVLMLIAAKASLINNINVTLSKDELLRRLKAIQSIDNLNEENSILIKELIELVKYSIPHLSQLNSKDNYEKLATLFNNKNIQNNDDLNIEEIKNAVFLAKNC